MYTGLYINILYATSKSQLPLKEAPTLEGGEELREFFTCTRVSPPINNGKNTNNLL